MSNYLAKHPEHTEVFCRECKTLKPAGDMKTRFKCQACFEFDHRKKVNAYRSRLKTLTVPKPKPEPIPEPEPESIPPPRKKRVWTMAMKAEVCEQHIGLGMSIAEIAVKWDSHNRLISKIISHYFGFGAPPITLSINFENTDDIKLERVYEPYYIQNAL